MDTWRPGDLETRRPGDLETRDLETWRPGDLETWRLEDLETWRSVDPETCIPEYLHIMIRCYLVTQVHNYIPEYLATKGILQSL